MFIEAHATLLHCFTFILLINVNENINQYSCRNYTCLLEFILFISWLEI